MNWGTTYRERNHRVTGTVSIGMGAGASVTMAASTWVEEMGCKQGTSAYIASKLDQDRDMCGPADNKKH